MTTKYMINSQNIYVYKSRVLNQIRPENSQLLLYTPVYIDIKYYHHSYNKYKKKKHCERHM